MGCSRRPPTRSPARVVSDDRAGRTQSRGRWDQQEYRRAGVPRAHADGELGQGTRADVERENARRSACSGRFRNAERERLNGSRGHGDRYPPGTRRNCYDLSSSEESPASQRREAQKRYPGRPRRAVGARCRRRGPEGQPRPVVTRDRLDGTSTGPGEVRGRAPGFPPRHGLAGRSGENARPVVAGRRRVRRTGRRRAFRRESAARRHPTAPAAARTRASLPAVVPAFSCCARRLACWNPRRMWSARAPTATRAVSSI